MLLKQEQINPCEVELEIEVEQEKVASAVDETYRELGKVANIRGFRKGKAPRHILELHVDRDKVRHRVVDKLMQPAYAQALDESKLDAYAPADVELVKFELGEPLVFKALVPLAPKVELGDYVGLDVERRIGPVTDEEVDKGVADVLERHAEYVPVTDRGAKTGDALIIEVKDDRKPDENPKRNAAVVGDNLPDFDEGLVGMRTDEEKVIEVGYPDDHPDEDLRGQRVPIWVKIVEIDEKKLPELTDEWVKKTFTPEAGDSEQPPEPAEPAKPEPDPLDTVEKLRNLIRASMDRAAVQAADEGVRQEIIKRVVESSRVCFPEVMVNAEVGERLDRLTEELKKRKVSLEAYLKHTRRSFEELRAEYEESARKLLARQLVLLEIVGREGITVGDDDVNAEIRRIAESEGVPTATVEAYLDRTDGRQSMRNRILHEKVMDFLVHASNIKSVGG